MCPKYISPLFDNLRKTSGIDTIACLHKNELLALDIIREKNQQFIPQQLFSPFVTFLTYLIKWGNYQQIHLELQYGRKILFFRKDEISEYKNLIFAHNIDRKSNIFFVLKKI